MKRGKKKLPHELFYLSYFGLKNCAIRCRIKFCTRKSNSFFSRLGAWYLEKQPNLKKWSEIKKKTFGIYSRKTGKCWNQTFCTETRLTIVRLQQGRSNFNSEPLKCDHAPFFTKKRPKQDKSNRIFLEKLGQDRALIL